MGLNHNQVRREGVYAYDRMCNGFSHLIELHSGPAVYSTYLSRVVACLSGGGGEKSA